MDKQTHEEKYGVAVAARLPVEMVSQMRKEAQDLGVTISRLAGLALREYFSGKFKGDDRLMASRKELECQKDITAKFASKMMNRFPDHQTFIFESLQDISNNERRKLSIEL